MFLVNLANARAHLETTALLLFVPTLTMLLAWPWCWFLVNWCCGRIFSQICTIRHITEKKELLSINQKIEKQENSFDLLLLSCTTSHTL